MPRIVVIEVGKPNGIPYFKKIEYAQKTFLDGDFLDVVKEFESGEE
nr:hypothetical protein [Lactiplantibacillus plantarum]